MTTAAPAKPRKASSKRKPKPSSKRAKPKAKRKPRPGTLRHFREWTKRVVLDTGDPWELESWQGEIIADVFRGWPIVWEVVPEGNGKTTLSAGIGLYHLDPEGWGLKNPRIVIAAHTSKQAEWLYGQAEGMVVATPHLNAAFRPLGGFKRIERRGQRLARLDVFAGDDAAADGAIYTLAFVEELHRHRDLSLYRVWTGKRRKRKGQVVVTSTAGEPNSEFEERRANILKTATKVRRKGRYGSYIRAESGRVVIHDYAVRNRERAGEIKVVKEANPFSAVTATELEENRDDPTMSFEHFLRFSCNIPTRVEGQVWTGETWDALADPKISPSSNAPKYGWLDLGWTVDTTALGVLSWESHECRIVTAVKIIKPPVDEGDIVDALVYRQREFSPECWVYDPNAGGQQMVQLLEKGEHPRQAGVQFRFVEHSQDNAPMAKAAARLDEAVRLSWLKHDGGEELRRHVMNGARVSLGGDKWKVDRPPSIKRSSKQIRMANPIDALTGILIGHSVAVTEQTNKAELIAGYVKR